MAVAPGRVTITPVYWAAAGYSFNAGYTSIIDGYIQNVAAASQTDTNVFAVAAQYYQQMQSTSPVQHVQYAVTAGQEVDDSHNFPTQGGATGCIADTGFSACVSDADLKTELNTSLLARGLPIDGAHLYVVMLPRGVESCEGAGVASRTNRCSTNYFCAYHAADGPPWLVYSSQPYPDLTNCADPWDGAPQAPNGDAAADAQVSLISHEANESITDAFGAWMDANQYENGDECAYVYGPPLGGTAGAYYNQVVGNGRYFTQDEFSNEDFAAGSGDATHPGGAIVPGCVQRDESPHAMFTAPSSLVAGVGGTFDGSASSDVDGARSALTDSWNWGDGSAGGSGPIASHQFTSPGTYTVMLTVTDPAGWSGTSSQTVAVASGPPFVTGISPASGLSAGGTTVTVSGAGFTGATGVSFGTATATPMVVSDTQLTVVAPPHVVGTVDLVVSGSHGSSSVSPADRFSYVSSGLYTLDAWGGMHGDDSPPVPTSAYWAGWNIARSAKALPVSGNSQSGFVLDGWGGLHAYGSATLTESSGAAGHYWPGWDIARDSAFLPDGSGGFVLDGWGGLHPFRVNGKSGPLTAQTTAYWPGWDIARKVVIFQDGTGGYVMDAWGGLHPFGINGAPPVKSVTASAYWGGWNIARDIVIVSGHNGYVLDGWGGVHEFHETRTSAPPPITPSGYWPGWDIARGLRFVPGSTTQGYTLDGWGGVHPFGGAPAIVNSSYWPGRDFAIGLCGE